MVDTHALSVAPDAKQVGRLMRLASLASMSVAIVLVLAKGAAWLVTDSVGTDNMEIKYGYSILHFFTLSLNFQFSHSLITTRLHYPAKDGTATNTFPHIAHYMSFRL